MFPSFFLKFLGNRFIEVELKGYNMFYLVQAVAWLFSFILLDVETDKKLPQSFLTHRWFWIAEFFLAIKNLVPFTQYNFVSLIFDLIRVIACSILCFFAVFRPFDFRTYSLNSINTLSNHVASVEPNAKFMLSANSMPERFYGESEGRIRSNASQISEQHSGRQSPLLLKLEKGVSSKKEPMDSIESRQVNSLELKPKDSVELKGGIIGLSLNDSGHNLKKSRKELSVVSKYKPQSRFEVLISKVLLTKDSKVLSRSSNDSEAPVQMFKIRTIIETEEFEIYRTLEEFNEIQELYSDIFRGFRFEENDEFGFLPAIPPTLDLYLSQYEFEEAYRDLQSFLQGIITQPRLVTKTFLAFLNVDQDTQSKYFRGAGPRGGRGVSVALRRTFSISPQQFIFQFQVLEVFAVFGSIRVELNVNKMTPDFMLRSQCQIVSSLDEILTLHDKIIPGETEPIELSQEETYEGFKGKVENHLNEMGSMEFVVCHQAFADFLLLNQKNTAEKNIKQEKMILGPDNFAIRGYTFYEKA